MQKSKGFTIVEVLIVVIIVGVLAAITVMVFKGVQGHSNSEPQYSITTPDGTNYWTGAYEEKDGCISFETWGRQTKTCGSYSVRQF